MIKRFLIALIIVGLFVGGLAYFKLVFMPQMIKEIISSQPQPAATITAEAAKTEEWTERLPAIGTLIASQGVEIAAQVSGIVTGLGFESGQDVEAGTKLVQLDVELAPQAGPRDHGKGRDDLWPTYDTAARLADAGVRFAIATSDGLLPRDLRFAAALASRDGLDEERALAAITLDAAEVLRLADSLGSLSAGKDADFVVYGADPREDVTVVAEP